MIQKLDSIEAAVSELKIAVEKATTTMDTESARIADLAAQVGALTQQLTEGIQVDPAEVQAIADSLHESAVLLSAKAEASTPV